MKTDVFPLNYFKSIWTPVRAFKNRFELNWLQIVFILIFLNALMIIPVTMNYTEMEFLPMNDFYPNAVQTIDEQAVAELQQVDYSQGEMKIDAPFMIENEMGVVAGGLAENEKESLINSNGEFILFEENQFIIGEEGLPTTTVLYARDFSLEAATNPIEVNEELSRQWFNQNRVLIVLIFSFMIAVFLLAMMLLLVFGAAFILYLTKKGKVTTIATYKEAVNLILNSLGVPTLAAMLFGIFYFDIYLMVTIQTVGLIIYLFVIFYKVQFNDEQVEAMGL